MLPYFCEARLTRTEPAIYKYFGRDTWDGPWSAAEDET
jgi:hypothetical protein